MVVTARGALGCPGVVAGRVRHTDEDDGQDHEDGDREAEEERDDPCERAVAL
jgi:hypothetical protein